MAETPFIYNDNTGLIIPDTSGTLAEVNSEWTGVFGADLIVTPDTPQGTVIAGEVLARDAVINNNAQNANQINPNVAGGVFLDGIMNLTGIQRTVQTVTVVTGATVTGVSGTTIPQGSLAQTAAGDLFQTATAVTIPSGGSTTVTFNSVAYGSVPCAIGALTTIVSGVLGWETVSNSVAGVLGTATQSDQSARAYRKNTLAYNGISLAEAITSALYATTGVTSLTFLENYEAVPAGMLISVTGGKTLAGTVQGLTTAGYITVDTTAMAFSASLQNVPALNPWPVAAYSTTGNIALTGLGTQSGGDWAGSLTAGQFVLAKNQTTASQNGVWVVSSGSWSRHTYNTSGAVILGALSGISLKANSVYACVNGGTGINIAASLLENKSSGAGWNGNTAVSVVEPASGQTYTVNYDAPTSVGVLVNITTTNGSASAITQSVLDYANGLINGFTGFTVGADVSPFEIAGAVMAENVGTIITNVSVSYVSPVSYSSSTLPIGVNQIATTQGSYINVTVSP